MRGIFLAIFVPVLLAGQSGDPAEALGAMRNWVDAKLRGVAAPAPAPHPFLRIRSGRVMRHRIQNLPLRIGSRQFSDGLAMRSVGELDVVLTEPARRFEATLGVDSNDVGYYANNGRGNAIAAVRASGRDLFRSPVLREGMPAIPVSLDLDGARAFTLSLTSAGNPRPYHQGEWDQADWAGARITLASGAVLRLGDLPFGTLAEAYPADAAPPFSFELDKRPASDLLANWTVRRSSSPIDAERTRHILSYSDAASGLRVECSAVSYARFPVAEWTLRFVNEGSRPTPLIENVRALDVRLLGVPGDDFLLHHMRGSFNSELDFQPLATPLRSNATQRFAPAGGRGSDETMPYFNLEWGGRGAIVAVGWPGQWEIGFTRDRGHGVRIAAGQENVHFRLMPGEEVRSPLVVLQLWTGDWIDGQNVWRRWMLAHNLPRVSGKLPEPQVAASSARQTAEMQEADEANQIEFLRRTRKAVPIDRWWMDAGWYPFAKGWSDTGTWEPDPKRFPNGLAPVTREAHKLGLKTIVWFEPERARVGSRLVNEHPEWLLADGGASANRLLFLGHPAAWRWLVAHVSGLIESQGIDIYRQDFNFSPLQYWRRHDAPDRQGISEIQHVTGYLAYFDDLRRRFPHLMIDTCASGGRRLDLETLRRAVPLWRSDHPFLPADMQAQTYGLALWVPYHGTGVNAIDPYYFRSQMSPAIALGLSVDTMEASSAQLRAELTQWRALTKYYYGDFYPLTSWSIDQTAWMAWQFDGGADGGMVQVFRRAASPFVSARLKLRGLAPGASYRLESVDAPRDARTLPGKALAEDGFEVSLPNAPTAAIYRYRRIK
jgi:alpha-galactosidase